MRGTEEGRDLDFGVATWSGQLEVATRNGCRDLAGLATGDLASRPRFWVATRAFCEGNRGRSRPGFWCRDLEILLWAETRSRHEIDVAT